MKKSLYAAIITGNDKNNRLCIKTQRDHIIFNLISQIVGTSAVHRKLYDLCVSQKTVPDELVQHKLSF